MRDPLALSSLWRNSDFFSSKFQKLKKKIKIYEILKNFGKF
jgi:hypothetical protein